MAKVDSGGKSASVESLVQICLKATNRHMSVLEGRISDLPASVLENLLPLLNIHYLDRIESVVQSKGITTSFAWESIFKYLIKTWRLRPEVGHPNFNWKQKSMEKLFHMVLYSHCHRENNKYILDIPDQSVLCLTAPHVQTLMVMSRKVCRLTSEDLKTALSELERGVGYLKLLDRLGSWEGVEEDFLYILHRLLDHGSVKGVEMENCYGLDLMNWVTTRCRITDRATHYLSHNSGDVSVAGPSTEPHCSYTTVTGSQCSDPTSNEGGACKRRRVLFDVSMQFPCDTFLPKCGPICPKGQIISLDMPVTPLEVTHVVSSLPSWLGLHTLHLHNNGLFRGPDLLLLLNSLQALCSTPGCRLRDLAMAVNHRTPVDAVLEACPLLTSLTLFIFPQEPGFFNDPPLPKSDSNSAKFTEFPLEKLYVTSNQGKIDMQGLLAALQQAPYLSLFHISGIVSASPVLNALAEFNKNLKSLVLADINLGRSHYEILHLLENSNLQDICFKESSILDLIEIKEDFLTAFVTSLKGLSTLKSLALPNNRLATNVKHLAELFSGHAPSTIMNLDLSGNFILPLNLLEFATLMRLHKPPVQPRPTLVLDIRFNPLDRDLDVKREALRILGPFCHVLTDNWDSRSTMADHISAM